VLPEFGPYFPGTAGAIEDLFAEARAHLWVWQWGKRRLLDRCERVALNHASGFAMRLAGTGTAPAMTAAEAAALAALL
jgi:hypothetical protein